MEKIRVALVSGYTDHKVREHLRLKKQSKLYKTLIKLFNLPERVGVFQDTTPWIDNLIYNIEKRPDVELHVICPQIRLLGSVQNFEMRGVYYHIISTEYSMLLRKINNYKLWIKLQNNGRRINRIVSRINPDIVVLSGAEGYSYSVAGLCIKDYPVFLLCQVVGRIALAESVVRSTKYIGVMGREHYDYVKELNPQSFVFDYKWPDKPLEVINGIRKKYDFINFAYRMNASKGFHDSVRALAIVKRSYPHVTMNLSGFCDPAIKKELIDLINQLGLVENISFTGFFEKQEDLFRHINEARFAVLPIKIDIISGTVLQAMFYGLPVVTNVTSGTPLVNEHKECLLLSEIDDVDMLAEKMLILMKDEVKAESLKKNAKEYFDDHYKPDETVLDRLLQDMNAIIANYRYEKIIPDELLYK